MHIRFSYHLLFLYNIFDALYKVWFSYSVHNCLSYMKQLLKEQEHSHGKGKAGSFYFTIYALLSVVQLDMSKLMKHNLHALNRVVFLVVGNHAALFPSSRIRKYDADTFFPSA